MTIFPANEAYLIQAARDKDVALDMALQMLLEIRIGNNFECADYLKRIGAIEYALKGEGVSVYA